MSKLEQVKLILENNPEIRIVNVNLIDHLKNWCGLESHFAQVFDFQVAPKNEMILDRFIAEKMQLFMNGLIPNLTPDKVYDFKEDDELLIPGRLCFDEIIAKQKIRIVGSSIICKELEVIQYLKKDLERTKEYIRRIYVSPFPDEKIADRYRYTNYIGCINLKKIKEESLEIH